MDRHFLPLYVSSESQVNEPRNLTLCPGRDEPARIVAMRDASSVADLLHEAAETHHIVYRIVDGDDPDWASWYAEWLLTLSELPQLLGSTPVRSHLVNALVQLDRDYS